MQVDNRFCRNCPHHRDSHIVRYHVHLINQRLIGPTCYGETLSGGQCDCPEYVPKDNLEYLEYCEAKRNSNETAKR